jgi:hypothetical protein
MIDETYRPRWARWAWLLGSAVSAGALVLACSANDTASPDDGGEAGGGGTGPGGTAGVAGNTTGGVGPTGGMGGVAGTGTGGTIMPGGTGSGGASGAQPTGGVGPTGGVSGSGVGGAAGTGATGGAGNTGGTAGASGGAGGGASLMMPILRGTNYVLEFGDMYFEVNPAGARVIDAHLRGGMNLLTPQNVDPNGLNYGSTFWPSPQTWAWPPTSSIPQINDQPYTPTIEGDSVLFVGQNATTVGASVMKRFTADLARGNVIAEYALVATAANKMFAPWEISRVYKRGLTFWPTGTAPRAGTQFPIAPTTAEFGCTWHQAPTANGTDQKLFANGTGGWLAHVDGDVVIVKKFPDIMASQAAPNEDEIEIYVAGMANYIEVEQQGAYQAVAMGSMLTWRVDWIVRRLPTGVTATAPNQALVTFVQSLVQ